MDVAAPAVAKPRPVFADGGNRLVAFLLDLTLLTILVVAVASNLPVEARGTVNWIVLLAYFGALPLTSLEGTVGKRMMGIRLCDRAGQRLAPGRSMLRATATLGWLWLVFILAGLHPEPGLQQNLVMAGWMAFFLAWAPIGFTPRGQSAFDLLAGTLVVRRGASPEEIAAAPPRKHSVVEIVVAIAGCLVLGMFIDIMTSTARGRAVRGRVSYAVEATSPLRDKVKEFRAREGRWPEASDLGMPEWTSYPDGGGYRLGRDGVVQIGFSVHPELKGRTIAFRPTWVDKAGAVLWECTADPALRKSYLPAVCR